MIDSEKTQPPALAPELSRLYSEIITPSSSVVVVGPSHSIFTDATLLFATYLASRGNVYVADPISTKNTTYDEMSQKVGGKVAGIGNVDNILSEISALQKAGLELQSPQWLGPESAAQKIPLPDESIDVIIDHNTSVFLAGKPERPNNLEEQIKELEKCYREYARVLKIGGHILLQTDINTYQLHDDSQGQSLLDSLLKKFGFSVIHQQVEDEFVIPIGGPFSQRVLDTPKYRQEEQLLYYINRRMERSNGKNVIKFRNTRHISNDVFIAQKVSNQ